MSPSSGRAPAAAGLSRLLAATFLVSGFSGLVCQVVWLRLAFARFGVITPVLSVLLSVFMAGMALGSWAGGRWLDRRGRRPLLVYAAAEFAIGLGALLTPAFFEISAGLLLGRGEVNSVSYLGWSGLAMTVSILPWCVAMGATYPAAMTALERAGERPQFGALYLANVAGAALGTLAAALVLIETFGFRTTSLLAAVANLAIALVAVAASGAGRSPGGAQTPRAVPREPSREATPAAHALLWYTGFSSMAMEVVWTRAFTPAIGTTIYAFALLLAVYLLATALGSRLYRERAGEGGALPLARLVALLALSALAPLVLGDPRSPVAGPAAILAIVPFCVLLGYLTPGLIERSGDARAASVSYAVNVVGCVLGPLAAGYALLPVLGVKWSLLVLAFPFVAAAGRQACRSAGDRALQVVSALAVAGVVFAAGWSETFEEGARAAGSEGRRDHTATIVSTGTGMDRRLLVNGIGITHLTPITKVMAHLPAGFLAEPPRTMLAICLGMGTTFRSLWSWGGQVTAVELVPSVPQAFGYYFADARAILGDPRARVVIDDGRRYLARTTERYDVITIDPPPPVEAAGSSLLYSREFYGLLRSRLVAGGVLQQWFPGGERKILQAVARSLQQSFPHVRVYRSVEGWGYHFLASGSPLEAPAAEDFVRRLPAPARRDLMEWWPGLDAVAVSREILSREVPLASLLDPDPGIAVTDDRPFNEYYLLRRLLGQARGGVAMAP